MRGHERKSFESDLDTSHQAGNSQLHNDRLFCDLLVSDFQQKAAINLSMLGFKSAEGDNDQMIRRHLPGLI